LLFRGFNRGKFARRDFSRVFHRPRFFSRVFGLFLAFFVFARLFAHFRAVHRLAGISPTLRPLRRFGLVLWLVLRVTGARLRWFAF
jgi:hypothetical protein